MTIEEALAFLAAHQPMPETAACDDALIGEFDSVRRFLQAHPDARSVPLLLGVFGGGDLHGVYQLVEDALRPYPIEVVSAHLATALAHGGPAVRYWGAQIAASFPDPRLLAPLTALLTEGDVDQRIAAVTALAQLGSPAARDVLHTAQALPLEPPVRELLDDVLGSNRVD